MLVKPLHNILGAEKKVETFHQSGVSARISPAGLSEERIRLSEIRIYLLKSTSVNSVIDSSTFSDKLNSVINKSMQSRPIRHWWVLEKRFILSTEMCVCVECYTCVDLGLVKWAFKVWSSRQDLFDDVRLVGRESKRALSEYIRSQEKVLDRCGERRVNDIMEN